MRYQSTDAVAFRATVAEWLIAHGEVAALITVAYGAGQRSVELFDSVEMFVQRLKRLSPRTFVTVFRNRQVPLRGIVDDAFVEWAVAQMPVDAEYVVVGLDEIKAGAGRWFTCLDGLGHGALREDLNDCRGERVGVGVAPHWRPWLTADHEEQVVAIVPEPDGSVVLGTY
jgi:hypothetical protein